MINLRILCLTACMVSFAFAHKEENESFTYREELEALKVSRGFKTIFKDEDVLPDLRAIQQDIENYKELTQFQRFARLAIMSFDVVVVTSRTMPQLYAYVDEVCKKAEIKMPTVFLSRRKGVFNAFAQKLFMSTGAIVIGQKLIREISDQELEAIVAHEIGHIKHNHVNKALLLTIPAYIAATKFTSYLNDRFFRNPLHPLADVYLTLSLTEDVRSLIINKRFEKQADEFACKVMGKAAGLAKFFERLKQKENNMEDDFIETYAAIENNKSQLALGDTFDLKLRYYITRAADKINKAYAWYYHNTPFGAHPSHDERIKAAKKYLAEHPEAA